MSDLKTTFQERIDAENNILGRDKYTSNRDYLRGEYGYNYPNYLPEKLNDFVIDTEANTTFTSNSNNNPYGLSLDDLKFRFGKERVMFAGLIGIEEYHKEKGEIADTPYDSDGKKGYYPINAKTHKVDLRIRFYGDWEFRSTTTAPNYLFNDTSGDYIVITDIMTELNMAGYVPGSSDPLSIYKNGVDTGNNITEYTNSTVLWSKNYQANHIVKIDANLSTRDIYTVKLVKDSTGQVYITGIEIINDQYASSQDILVPAGSKVIKGEKIDITSKTGTSSLNYKGVLDASISSEQYDGTKGARIAYYIDVEGNIISKKTQVEEQTMSATADLRNPSDYDKVDRVSGAATSVFYDNGQGNLLRVKDATGTDKFLLCPSAENGSSVVFQNDYDGNNLLAMFSSGSNQYQDDGTTNSTFADSESVTVELYGKVLANADFSNSEVSQILHARDFGAGRSDDFSTLVSTSSDRAFTLDDGITTLTAKSMTIDSTGRLGADANTDYCILTFIGTGLSYNAGITNQIDIISDLPYGVHTFKLYYNNSVAYYYIDGVYIGSSTYSPAWRFNLFTVYQPKTPELSGYKPHATYNILADQVLTSLPVNNSGIRCIDQGAIRKSPTREHVYIGSWSYGSVDPNKLMGINVQITAGNDGSASLTFFGKGKFRPWMINLSTSDTQDILVDGSKVLDYTPPSTNQIGYYNSAFDISDLGLHTVTIERDIFANNVFAVYGFDYHTPIYEPANWNTNPYRDYLIDNCGMDKRKLTAIDEKNIPREYFASDISGNYYVATTSSPGTLLPYTNFVLDAGKYMVDFQAMVESPLALTTNQKVKILIVVDGSVVGSATWIENPDESVVGRLNLGNKVPITLTKRSCVGMYVFSDSTSIGVRTGASSSNYTPSKLHIRKISDI